MNIPDQFIRGTVCPFFTPAKFKQDPPPPPYRTASQKLELALTELIWATGKPQHTQTSRAGCATYESVSSVLTEAECVRIGDEMPHGSQQGTGW